MSSPGVSAYKSKIRGTTCIDGDVQSVARRVCALLDATLQIQHLVPQPVFKVCRIDKAHTVDHMSDAGLFKGVPVPSDRIRT